MASSNLHLTYFAILNTANDVKKWRVSPVYQRKKCEGEKYLRKGLFFSAHKSLDSASMAVKICKKLESNGLRAQSYFFDVNDIRGKNNHRQKDV